MAEDEAPADPISMMREGMAQMHELFLGMVEAGFTRIEACHIIGVLMAENGRNAP